MSGSQPLFASQGSALGEGVFWIDICFTEMNGAGIQEGAWDRSMQWVVAASGLAREYVHWAQQHGTRFGVFVFLIGHRRQEIVECFLRKLTVDRRAEALRRWREHRPLWPLVTSDDYGAFVDKQDRTLRRLIDHWRALFALEKMWLAPNSPWAEGYSPVELFRLTSRAKPTKAGS